MRFKKGDVEVSQLIGIGFALLVLGIFLLFYFYGKNWAVNALDFVKNFIRFGR